MVSDTRIVFGVRICLGSRDVVRHDADLLACTEVIIIYVRSCGLTSRRSQPPMALSRLTRLERRAAAQWQAILATAKKDAIVMVVVSGFRSFDYQRKLVE
jgi:hypothetical protein